VTQHSSPKPGSQIQDLTVKPALWVPAVGGLLGALVAVLAVEAYIVGRGGAGGCRSGEEDVGELHVDGWMGV